MRWGRLEVTGGFLLLVAWLNYLDRQCILPLTLVACLAHELGHYGAIRLLRGNITRIRVTAVGAEMSIAHPMGYVQEGIAALAGPGVNLFLALVFSIPEWGSFFSGLNLVLGCFNLMPAGRLDGGRALRCTLSLLAGQDVAVRIGERLDVIVTCLFLAAGWELVLRSENVTLLLIALWLLSGRKNEKKGGNRSCQTVEKGVK